MDRQTSTTTARGKASTEGRVIKFATKEQVKKASAWAIRKYAWVFKKLAE